MRISLCPFAAAGAGAGGLNASGDLFTGEGSPWDLACGMGGKRGERQLQRQERAHAAAPSFRFRVQVACAALMPRLGGDSAPLQFALRSRARNRPRAVRRLTGPGLKQEATTAALQLQGRAGRAGALRRTGTRASGPAWKARHPGPSEVQALCRCQWTLMVRARARGRAGLLRHCPVPAPRSCPRWTPASAG